LRSQSPFRSAWLAAYKRTLVDKIVMGFSVLGFSVPVSSSAIR